MEADPSRSSILPDSLQVVEDSTLKELVADYNKKHFKSLRVQGKNTLLLPTEMIQAAFCKVIQKCVHHVKELLEVRGHGTVPCHRFESWRVRRTSPGRPVETE